MEILTWTCLDNHFHVLVSVPNKDEGARLRADIGEEEIFGRMQGCFAQDYINETRWRLRKFRSTPGMDGLADAIIERLRAQMYDVSAFMHMVQRRFSAWYNRKHGRKGTLWQGRFRSTLIEESGEALLRTAVYIDLNAVRAGIATDPGDYRWCGYAEALAGRKEAHRGIGELVRSVSSLDEGAEVSAVQALHAYQDWLADIGRPVNDESGATIRPGFESRQSGSTGSGSARPGRAELLRRRVRYFTASLAIGSRTFVESVFRRYRGNFAPARTSGARALRHGDWSGLCGLRDLRKDVVGPGGDHRAAKQEEG